MKRYLSVEVITVLVAFAIFVLWVTTHYVETLWDLSFSKNFLAQLGNMAMLALGVLGISKVTTRPPVEHNPDHTGCKCSECGKGIPCNKDQS